MAAVGFVGLGVMGRGIARRLLLAGHTVYGYNRTPEKAAALVELGLVQVGSPREAAEHASVVFSMVTDTEAVEAVTRGPDGILAGLGAREALPRHVDGVAGEQPRACGRRRGARRPHARRARLGLGHDDRAGQARDHGRRQPRTRSPRSSRSSATSGPVVTLGRRERPGGAAQDRDQPERRRADGRVLRGPADRREGRDRPRGGASSAMLNSRDREPDAQVPGAVRPRAARRGVVRLQPDAEGPATSPSRRAASSTSRCRRPRSRTS